MKLQTHSGGYWIDVRAGTENYYLDGILGREAWATRKGDRRPMTERQQVLDYLAGGKALKYDDSWDAELRDADAVISPAPRPAEELVRCDCGHSVPRALVMSASLGSSCPDCYDNWS